MSDYRIEAAGKEEWAERALRAEAENERLRGGLIEYPKRWSGDTHADMGGSVDYDKTDALLDEAADRIEALETENARLREALKKYTCACSPLQVCTQNERDFPDCGWTARTALEQNRSD